MGSNILAFFILLSLTCYPACKVTPPEVRYELGFKLNWANKTPGQDPYFSIGKLHNGGVPFEYQLDTDKNGANCFNYAIWNESVSTISTINKQFYFVWAQTPRLNGFMRVSNIIVWEKSFIINQLIATKKKIFKPIWTQIWTRIPMRFTMTSGNGGGGNGGSGSRSGAGNGGDANNADSDGDKDYKSCVVSVSMEFSPVSTYAKTYPSNVAIAITDYLKFDIGEVWISETQNMATEKLSEYPFSIQKHVASNLSVIWNSFAIPQTLRMASIMLNELCDGQQTFALKFIPENGQQVLASGNEQILYHDIDCGTGLMPVHGMCQYKPCNEMGCEPNGRCEEGIEFVGSRCKCNKNFIVDGEGCSHVCFSDQHGCGDHSSCAHDATGNGWTCKCDEGYADDGQLNCVEKKPKDDSDGKQTPTVINMICGTGLKMVNGKCQYKPCNEMSCGSYGRCEEGIEHVPSRCKCKNKFYKQVGEECVHICSTNLHGCPANSKCTKNKKNDHFTCPCNERFIPDGVGGCIIDLCPIGWHLDIRAGKCVQNH